MELEKFKEKNNKRTGIIIFTVCCILLITGVYLYSSFAIYEQNQNFNIINGTVEDPGDLYFSFYVDGVISKTMPTKGSGYTLDTTASYCTNGASPVLNADDWSVSVNNLTVTNTKCTLYFVKGVVGQIIDQLDKTGACPTVNDDGTVQVTGEEENNGYLCSALDDYGTSYYYRGNVTNNYVKFGTNESGQDMYWRIIRINGDGSIRIIYDGTSAHANGEASEDRQTATSVYNSSYNDNAYVGYMYGTPGSSSYAETHANTNDSTIKVYLDNWYKRVFSGTSYESYIVDNIFCNDRSLLQEEPIDFQDTHYSQLGYGKEWTAYRWYGDPMAASMGEEYALMLTYPNLQCAEQNDQFTVSDEVIGNGALTYPIGLITTDEVYLAGGFAAENYDYYLYTGDYYWTMSPFHFNYGLAFVRLVSSDGNGNNFDYVAYLYGVRPTLNLIPDSLKVGSGTAADPYMVG